MNDVYINDFTGKDLRNRVYSSKPQHKRLKLYFRRLWVRKKAGTGVD